jgi:predicted RNA-binding protein YlqC (UPF0109 family)
MTNTLQADSARAKDLLNHLLTPLFSHVEDMVMNVIEGSATVIIELKVHEADHQLLIANEESLLRNVQQILTVASNERKFSLDLLSA